MAKLELYVGRAFLLKNFRVIQLHKRRQRGYSDRTISKFTEKEKSGAVVVIEEGAKKIRVVTAEGRVGWISRNYLQAEISRSEQGVTKDETVASLFKFFCKIEDRLSVKENQELSDILVILKNIP
jgi:hypothetical protein